MTVPTFQGNDEQQALVAEIFQLMVLQASFYADDALIRQTLANLTTFLAEKHNREPAAMAASIEEAIALNNVVFRREEIEDATYYITTRRGVPEPLPIDTSHTFAQRLHEPENPLPVDDISVVVSTTRPTLTTVEPVYISDYWQRASDTAPKIADDAVTVPTVDAEPTATVPDSESVAAEPMTVDDTSFAAVTDSPAVVVVAGGVPVDLRHEVADILAQHGDVLQAELANGIDKDPLRQMVRFGNMVLPEDRLINLGKRDLGRIRDDISAANEPLLDTVIQADVYNQQPGENEVMRFSLNYRLGREKDFEYVGVAGANLWSLKTLPYIGTRNVKTNELAQFTEYLMQGYDESLQERPVATIVEEGFATHRLSFFEWANGVVLLTAALNALIAQPLLDDQRRAVLRFVMPQDAAAEMLVEVRYPVGSRGGWMQGFDLFFNDFLIAGALITIARTEEPYVYTIIYDETTDGQTRDVLVPDEKKNRFVFEEVTYYCQVDLALSPDQASYPQIRNLKALPMSDRRRANTVLRHVIETLGEAVGTASEPAYRITEQTVYTGFNVLRPASLPYITALLNDNQYVQPADEPGVYVFAAPLNMPDEADDADEPLLEDDNSDE